MKSPLHAIVVCENSLYSSTKNFKENIDTKYKKTYDEIDLSRNGFILLDDIINIVILLGLINHTDKDHSYLSIKNKALEIFSVFYLVSTKSKISRKDFFAVCSVYEYNNPDASVNEFFKLESFQRLKSQITDLRQVFACYAKDNTIDHKELKSILACIQADDIYQLESLVCVEAISFARFLRFLPFFLWMHQEVVKQLEIR